MQDPIDHDFGFTLCGTSGKACLTEAMRSMRFDFVRKHAV